MKQKFAKTNETVIEGKIGAWFICNAYGVNSKAQDSLAQNSMTNDLYFTLLETFTYCVNKFE